LEDKIPDNQKELLEASKVLLTKLTKLTVGQQGLNKIPKLLEQLFAGFGLESPSLCVDSCTTITTTTETTTTTTTTTTLRTRNFKHNRLSSFYKNRLNASTAPQEQEDQRLGLLSSLRNQIITSALQDRKIVAKANNIPLYSPARKVAKKKVKVFYGKSEKKEETTDRNIQLQEGLATELNNTLKSHLQSLLTKVQTKKRIKQEYEESVVSSVKEQLEKFTEMLDDKSTKLVNQDSDTDIQSDLAKALETRLRSFYTDL